MALNFAVISDSTTLISLINIERFEILFRFTDVIYIAPSVYDEVSVQKQAKECLDSYIASSRIVVCKVENRQKVKELLIRLDLGESESIALAIEKDIPLIIDEKRGKNIANMLDVDTIGLVGILLLYRKKEYLSKKEIMTIVSLLKEVKFRVSDTLLKLLVD